MDQALKVLTTEGSKLAVPLGTLSLVVVFLAFIVAGMAPDFSREHRRGFGLTVLGVIGALWTPVVFPALVKLISPS